MWSEDERVMELKLNNFFVEPAADPGEPTPTPDAETVQVSGMLCGL